MKKISFPTIDPTIRRLLIFFSTVSIGSVFIIYDVSTEMLIIGTVAAGSLTLFIFGAARLSDLRPSQIKKAVHKAVEEFKARKEKSTERKSADETKASLLKTQAEGKSGSIVSVLKSFTEAVGGGAERLKATLFHKDEKFEEIDTALAAASVGVAGGAAAAAASGAAAGSGGAGGLDLDDEEFDDALEGLDLGDDLDDLEEIAGADGLGLSLDEEVPGAAAETSADPEPDDAAVSAILEAHSDELEEFEELGEIEDLDADLSGDLDELDDLDLDSLEIDEGEVEGVQPEPEEEEDVLPEAEAPAADLAPPQETGGEAGSGEDGEGDEGFDMLAFANGGGDSSGLLDLLKEDVKKKKTEDYDSLVRDMKGQKFKADDLVNELEDTLKELGSETVKNTEENMNE
ncbi:hypothetical protein J2129_000638 [Methanofollis sp. W23]|uniref:hypothetical protein n=1 Tax=Methanofollis sp. W23 TaxID=2817849 RepID=UPI001AE15169|nr:hypothetical protein [Methanofollis sp. W23]MBP2145184.1 hypothetical protein [Methanofollis sp. W23]